MPLCDREGIFDHVASQAGVCWFGQTEHHALGTITDATTDQGGNMRFPLLFTLVVGTLLSACGGGSSGSTPTTPSSVATSTFQGTIAGSGPQSGTLTFTVQSQVAAFSASIFRWPFIATLHAQATTVAASGSVHVVGGGTIALSGTFDSSTRALSLAGGGFAFTGSLVGAVVSGTYTGPSGVTGGFSSLSTASGTVTAYCGNVFSSGPGQANVVTGVFNLAASGATGAVSGAFHVAPNSGFITGQVSGTAFTITYGDRTTGEQGAGTGTIQDGTMSGRSTSNNPFWGSTRACQ